MDLTKDWDKMYKNDSWSWKIWSESVLRKNYTLGAIQYIDEQNLDTEIFFSSVFFSPMIDNYAKQRPVQVGHISKILIECQTEKEFFMLLFFLLGQDIAILFFYNSNCSHFLLESKCTV